jgi:RES domain
LREVLAPLAPNSKARANFQKVFGAKATMPATTVSWKWRQQRELARGQMEFTGTLINLDDPAVLTGLEQELVELLAKHNMQRLYISQIRSEQREVTQAIARLFFEAGAAGVVYGSNRDNLPCVALFEGRAVVRKVGLSIPLTENVPDLIQVCNEYGLVLQGPSGN